MALVTGRLSDLGWTSMTPYAPAIRFYPTSRVGSSARIYGSRVLPSKPVDATIVGTNWTVDLVPTVGMIPETWYELRLGYLDSEHTFTTLDTLPIRLTVTGAGGEIGDLSSVPFSPENVWVGLDPPPAGFNGWWLHSAPGDPDNPLSSGTGELRSWRTV